MRFPDQKRVHSGLAKMVAKRQLADLQRHAVPGGAVRAGVAAGIEGHPRRAAYRRLDIATLETNPPACQPVDVRGVEVRMAGTAQIIKPELVEHDEEDVLLSGHMTMVFLRPQKIVPEAPEIECTS